MIAVKIYWNTDSRGEFITETVELGDMPCSYYGPFDSIVDAISWMENDYPDGDTEVHDMVADDFDLPESVLHNVNAPDSIFGDIPDTDIREESREIHGP